MEETLIFTDTRGHSWICGKALRHYFHMSEPCNRHFWNYNDLARKFYKCISPSIQKFRQGKTIARAFNGDDDYV